MTVTIQLPACFMAIILRQLMWISMFSCRESFPNDLQFTILMRFTVDQTQTPNLKVDDKIMCVSEKVECVKIWSMDGMGWKFRDADTMVTAVMIWPHSCPRWLCIPKSHQTLNPGLWLDSNWSRHSTGFLFALLQCGHSLQVLLL